MKKDKEYPFIMYKGKKGILVNRKQLATYSYGYALMEDDSAQPLDNLIQPIDNIENDCTEIQEYDEIYYKLVEMYKTGHYMVIDKILNPPPVKEAYFLNDPIFSTTFNKKK